MTKQKKKKLCVTAEGKRRYISVPQARSKELHEYLRSKRVRSARTGLHRF
ncbi:MAG: hypothetical protein L0Y72_15505 [Gemmataceae bacterium]|nr:hypothetical protein [Gemmataceae bacterium]MCI0740452.1 hypothetical protein [Gemmataceae bacterium]